MADTPEHIDLDATEARQGRRGRHVFWILTVSTSLAIVAVFGVWATHTHAPAQPQPPAAIGEAQPRV